MSENVLQSLIDKGKLCYPEDDKLALQYMLFDNLSRRVVIVYENERGKPRTVVFSFSFGDTRNG